MSDLEKTFEEQPGSPQSQLLKKVAKEKSAAKKAKKYEKVFYTKQNNKVLQVIAKPHGACTVYVGRTDKDKASEAQFKESLAKWKKENVWVSEEDYEDTIGAAVKELAAKKEKDQLAK